MKKNVDQVTDMRILAEELAFDCECYQRQGPVASTRHKRLLPAEVARERIVGENAAYPPKTMLCERICHDHDCVI